MAPKTTKSTPQPCSAPTPTTPNKATLLLQSLIVMLFWLHCFRFHPHLVLFAIGGRPNVTVTIHSTRISLVGHKNVAGELCNARPIDCKLIILYLINVLWVCAVMLCYVQMYHTLFITVTYCLHLSPFLSDHYAYHSHLLITRLLSWV